MRDDGLPLLGSLNSHSLKFVASAVTIVVASKTLLETICGSSFYTVYAFTNALGHL